MSTVKFAHKLFVAVVLFLGVEIHDLICQCGVLTVVLQNSAKLLDDTVHLFVAIGLQPCEFTSLGKSDGDLFKLGLLLRF